MAEHDAYGPALQMAMFTRGLLPDKAEVETVCDRLRAVLSR